MRLAGKQKPGYFPLPLSEQFWEDFNPRRSYIQATASVRRAEA